MNSTGLRLRFTTFGESHGSGIGVVIDGIPSGLRIDLDLLEYDLGRRRGNTSKHSIIGATLRHEQDKAEILSGVFEGESTGTPLAMFFENKNMRSKDYEEQLLRPSHADFTYLHKYEKRDFRGGGRSSARESVARVAVGAVAKMILREVGTKVEGGIYALGGISSTKTYEEIDFSHALTSSINSLDEEVEAAQISLLREVIKDKDSVGAEALIKISGCKVGLGEPLYHKLDSVLASLFMGLNGVKAVEIGAGINASKGRGSKLNDEIFSSGFKSNNAGGILGGISNGDNIFIKAHFKPTPSIFREQDTIDINGCERKITLKGRHDACIALRGVVVLESLAAFALADALLLNMSAKLANIKTIYGG